jgi:two-component system, sensor histidine kinase PdtaS
MRLVKVGAACSDLALAAVLGQAYGRPTATASPPSIALTWRVTAGAFVFLLAGAADGAFWSPQTTYWQALALLAIAAILAALIARVGSRYFRLAAERDEAVQLSLERETRLAEAQHRIGNNLSVISALLSLKSRQLADLGARRVVEQAAGRIRVVAEVNQMLNHLTSADARIDNMFVGELVAKCIEAAGAENRVRHETSIDPIDLPKPMLTPLALILNECVNNALEHGFPGDAQGVIIVRLEARSDEQGARRLTIADDGRGPPGDFNSATARSSGLAFVNAFALQLGGSFRLERDERGTRAVLTF